MTLGLLYVELMVTKFSRFLFPNLQSRDLDYSFHQHDSLNTLELNGTHLSKYSNFSTSVPELNTKPNNLTKTSFTLGIKGAQTQTCLKHPPGDGAWPAGRRGSRCGRGKYTDWEEEMYSVRSFTRNKLYDLR